MSQQSTRRLMLILGATTFISMVGVGIIVPFLPLYARELGAGGMVMGLIFSSFSAARAITVPYVGALSDRWGRKVFIMGGLVGYALCALALLWVHSPLELVLNRATQGVFAAMVLPVSLALVADVTPTGSEGRYLGSFQTALLMGFGVGPAVGGVVYDLWGLNANFLLMAGLSAASLAAVGLFIKEPADRQAAVGQHSMRNQLALAGDRPFLALLAARVGSAMGMGCFVAFLPVLATDAGLTNTQVGMLLFVNVIVMVVMQPISGWLTDKWRRLPLAVGGLVFSGLAKAALPFAHTFWLWAWLCALEGLAAGLALPPNTALAVRRGRQLGHGMGLTMGLFTMAMSVGVFVGPVAGGWLRDAWRPGAALWYGGAATVMGALALGLWGSDPGPPPGPAAPPPRLP